MAGLTDLTAQAIGAPDRFNWTWFIEICVCGILALFFLFYFNRLFATLVSYGIRAYAWHHYRVWVDIQALQISLLGGRIFFKGIRYHGENETVFIHNGYLTWRYWIRNVRHADLVRDESQPDTYKEQADDFNRTSSSSGDDVVDLEEDSHHIKRRNNSDARVSIFVSGLEWFIYNRTPMYDAILKGNDGAEPTAQKTGTPSKETASSEALKLYLLSKIRKRAKSDRTFTSESSRLDETNLEKITVDEMDPLDSLGRQSTMNNDSESTEDITFIQSSIVQLLPVYIECSRAAISIGNEHTKAILVTTFTKAKGHIDARSCGPHDLFRQVFDFEVEHPVVRMKPNPDFIGSQLAVAERIIVASDPFATKSHWWQWSLDIQKRKYDAIHALRDLVPGMQSSVESLHHSRYHQNTRAAHAPFVDDTDGGRWHGLSRYMDENDTDDHHAWAAIDYARFSTMVDCPSVHFTFYWDSPGRVKAEHAQLDHADRVDQVNGIAGPAYGMELTVRGGDVNYGPWTDRLRAEIQAVFLPASYKSSTPALPLDVGEWRQFTTMTIRVDIEEEVRMRVPTRENSKDWRWRGRVSTVRDAAVIRKQPGKRHFRLRKGPKRLLGPDVRPFGWMSFSVDADSSVRYIMAMVAGEQGYTNKLSLDLKNTRATSSVNHADLWRCQNQVLECDVSNPLVWNSQHTWQFDIQSRSMDMFILRDHMFLLTDLISDFTAGQKSDYMTFVPFEYKIGLHFDGLKLFLNANDFNIIDSPCDPDSNAYLVLGLGRLEGTVDIPMRYFAASQNSVIFKAHGDDLFLDLKTPIWNTVHYFAKDENMATLKTVDLTGSYNYHAATSNQLTDSLFMDIVGGSPIFHLQGALIRYFMNVKENYFGEDLHFRTLEEYQDSLGPNNRFIAEDQRRQVKSENDLDVILNVRAEESRALMPANIYERDENIRVDVMLVEADMRFTNYYMDLQVNCSPIEVSVQQETSVDGATKRETTNCQLYISNASVYGHRLFGAPPTEPTYVCNWDFDIGSIYGECSSIFGRVLIGAIQSFVFTLDDQENALPVTRATDIHDITFLRARVDTVQVWLVSSSAAFLLDLGGAQISFSDWAGRQFSQNIKADVPSLTFAVVDPNKILHRREKSKHIVHTLACVQTSVRLASIDKKAEFVYQRDLQQNHIKFHDLRTHRSDFLLHDDRPINATAKEVEWSQIRPTMPVPELPHPLIRSSLSKNAKLKPTSRRAVRRQGSFLSSQSSLSDRKQSRQSHLKGLHVESSNGQRRSPADPQTFRLASNQPATTRSAPFSSAWIEPRFSLRKLCLDMSNMPIPNPALMDDDSPQSGDYANADYNDSGEALLHTGVFAYLPTGIKAFTLPTLFPATVDFLQELSPRSPAALLDIIQQSTFSNINALTTEHKGQKIDFALRVPVVAIRMVNEASQLHKLADLSADQYDLVVSHIRFTGRTAPTIAKQAQGQSSESILLLQASVGGVDIHAEEQLRSRLGDLASLRCSIRDTNFWLSIQDGIRTKAQIGSFEASTGGGTVDRLSMLAERSRVMIADIATEFDRLDQADRIHDLMCHLTQTEAETPDPVFLSRPSVVLRSAEDHVRSADSWKILARLRQRLMQQQLQQFPHHAEEAECSFTQNRDKARDHILRAVERWKTWDQDGEACRPLFSAIFGVSKKPSSSLAKVDDVEAEVYLGQFSVVLDPGPQQSELILQSGDLSFSQKPVLERTSDQNLSNFMSRSRLRLQMWFAGAALNLNWNLIELSKSLIKQINTSERAENNANRSHNPGQPKAAPDLDLVVVAGTDNATATIRTINLNLYMAACSLKGSGAVQLLGSNLKTSLLVAASSAQLRFASRYKKLLSWRLESPNLYGSYQQNLQMPNSSGAARFAASCNRLRFNMKEDVIVILEVVNTLIRDEVTIIQEVIASLEQKHATKPATASSPISLRLEDIRVAFFLNNYKLRFRLFPVLRYNIVGAVARTSIVPRKASTYAVHVDLKRHRHMLVEPGRRAGRSVAALEIPPINGRVVIQLSHERLDVNARSTLERITVEASAVQACVEAAYQPQNIQYLKNAKILMERIQNSASQLQQTPSKRTTRNKRSESSPPRLLFYTVNAVLEGVAIHCNAPAAHSGEHMVDLKFGIQETTIRIHNHGSAQSERPCVQPQFDLNLHQVFVDLYRRERLGNHNFGHFSTDIRLVGTTQVENGQDHIRNYKIQSRKMQLDLFTETAALVVDMAMFLQNTMIEMTTIDDRRKIRPLRRLTLANDDLRLSTGTIKEEAPDSIQPSNLLDTTFELDLNAIWVRYIIAHKMHPGSTHMPEDMVFSIRQIDFRTQREGSARLTILDTQLQTVPKTQEDPVERTANSALLPEMIFNAAHFATKKDRRFAFQAAGKALDLRLAADGIVPISGLQRSLSQAVADLRQAKLSLQASEKPREAPQPKVLGNKNLASLLVDADFAGAVVTITPRDERREKRHTSAFNILKGSRRSRAGRYGQAVQNDGMEHAVLRAPGIAVKVEYQDTQRADPTLSTEIKIAASSNTLAPSVVPLVMEIYSSVKEIIGEDDAPDTKTEVKIPSPKLLGDDTTVEADPTAILGRMKLNAAIWVQRQEFSLTCQPIARVAASARFDDIFIAINTVQGNESERFVSITTTFNNLQSSVQHVYSRDSTASFEVESIVISLMNSKHVNAKSGISAILNISPMRASLNAKQMQDFLLFREIWYPAELRQRSKPPTASPPEDETQAYAMQKYHELASTAAVPWHAVVSIQELKVDVDFGQSLGRSSFAIAKLWASSKKNSDWEQNLCMGFDRIGIDSSGRMSGFIELRQFHARTSIRWPMSKDSGARAPLVQASLGFEHLRLKAAFDYQPFAVADISLFEFLMYNVRSTQEGGSDRLVGILEGGKVQVFCISAAAAQALSIVQAFERLFQEKREAFQDSLHELDRLLRRKSIFPSAASSSHHSTEPAVKVSDKKRESHRLHTDVVVTLKAVDIGAFPNTFFDNQILKVEAEDAQARFAVATKNGKLRSGLGMTLGQVRVALSAVGRTSTKALGEVEVAEVIERATSSRGGTILKVPRLVASMQTWQEPHKHIIQYIFKSTFQGKVDVGWNYSRIRFIRGMWETHSQALAHRLGKPLPPAAVKITAEPHEDGAQGSKQEKITAVVNVPQSSKFEYVALEPPVIDTPQLRDMGEATPPLEWIGLNRDKLPNVTHSIVIVTLLEVAREVEDAYTKILGAG